jgi:histidyl-tRNA synthetase
MNRGIIQRVKGTRDFYPEDFRKQEWLISQMKKVLYSYGYEEYTAPILESMELFAAKSSVEIVEKQSYVLRDRSDEQLVLRPEMTPSLARMVAAKQYELPSVLRWFSVPECWRYEAPQKGRLRNFVQLNVDLLGSESVLADKEIIDIAIRILESLGIDLKTITVRISDRVLMGEIFSSLNIEQEKQKYVFSVLDKKDKITEEVFVSLLKELCLTDDTIATLKGILSNPEQVLETYESANSLKDLLQTFKEEKCRVVFDPTIARGFSYYTGTVFEIFQTGTAFKRAIFGGGRYSNLLEDVGGKPMSGIGFGVSDVVLEAVLKEEGREITSKRKLLTMVIPFSEAEEAVARQIEKTLRIKGVSVVSSLPPYIMKKQLKLASDFGVTQVILILPDELKRGMVVIKNMESGEQQIIKIDSIDQL